QRIRSCLLLVFSTKPSGTLSLKLQESKFHERCGGVDLLDWVDRRLPATRDKSNERQRDHSVRNVRSATGLYAAVEDNEEWTRGEELQRKHRAGSRRSATRQIREQRATIG